MSAIPILSERKSQIYRKGQAEPFEMTCGKQSLAGSISQRACVFCGSRVVLYPIADALHLIHGGAHLIQVVLVPCVERNT